MSRFLSPRLSALAPYTPGEQPQEVPYVKLNTNESPYPPAPGVLAAVNREEVARLNRYSDPTSRALEAVIAEQNGLQASQVICGNGSDEILAFCFQAFCDQETPPCFADVTYGFYPVFASLYGLTPRIVPLDENLRVNPSDYDGLRGVVILANPNAPTGQYLPPKAVAALADQNPERLLIVDEAYIDFGGVSAVGLLPGRDNLLIVQTFSKSRNLAGARIGCALGGKALIDDLRAIKYAFNPYNLGRLSQRIGVAAVAEAGYYQQCAAAIIDTREYTAGALRALGFMVLDSMANFLFAKPPKLGGGDYYRALKARGVLVRHFDAPRTRDFVRVTIGTRPEMERLLAETRELLK
ncbi:MAG: aminotransferase class I/II-fold pyridoxal phosphate-dependent enzyme [Oscillospiraceae bacterium]|jgi:histidinol-phosphate aminotransferase|nr:aminotransferase class I/II-fold pyridoxal phosphate-dependent enzyme [Oscillospiraceae bacterium]